MQETERGHRRALAALPCGFMLLSADHAIRWQAVGQRARQQRRKVCYPEGEGRSKSPHGELEGTTSARSSGPGHRPAGWLDIDQPRTTWVSRSSMAWFVRCRGISPLRPAHQGCTLPGEVCLFSQTGCLNGLSVSSVATSIVDRQLVAWCALEPSSARSKRRSRISTN